MTVYILLYPGAIPVWEPKFGWGIFHSYPSCVLYCCPLGWALNSSNDDILNYCNSLLNIKCPITQILDILYFYIANPLTLPRLFEARYKSHIKTTHAFMSPQDKATCAHCTGSIKLCGGCGHSSMALTMSLTMSIRATTPKEVQRTRTCL